MKKHAIMFVMAMLSTVMAMAEQVTYQGVFITISGSDTFYKLDDTPKISISDTDGGKVAVLTLNGKDEPVLTIPVDGNSDVHITYGTYEVPEATSIDTVTPLSIRENNGRKIITGGRLVIIKDGKRYNANGTRVM